MDERRLAKALSAFIGPVLATQLVEDFVKIRTDCATKTLERASPGKFVETFVQCLQQLEQGAFDARPNVDEYLAKRVESTSLPEGLRICAARVARSIYTLRNKRNIAHKNNVDPNTHDLALAHQAAAWVMAELLRNATGLSMEEAGALIRLVQTPVGTLVEEIGNTRLVLADVGVREELLILLHSHYPDVVPVAAVVKSLSRRSSGTVRNRLRELHAEKLVHGDAKTGYVLTQTGYAAAVAQIRLLPT